MDIEYFSGLSFSLGGSKPSHAIWHRHVPTYYGIQYNHSGSLRLRIDKRIDVSMSGPCAFVSHPKAFFEYGTADGKSRHHNFVCFFGPRVEAFIKGGLIDLSNEKPLVRIERPQSFLQTISELSSSIKGRSLMRLSHSRMAIMLEDLLLQMSEGSATCAQELSGRNEKLLSILSELERHPERPWDFEAVARELGISQTHLRRLFKQIAGTPPNQYLIRLRLKLAAEMLANSDMPLSEIGLAAGIGEEYYFSRLFKQRYALSPSKYRKEFDGHS